jgi:hypothetical protein
LHYYYRALAEDFRQAIAKQQNSSNRVVHSHTVLSVFLKQQPVVYRVVNSLGQETDTKHTDSDDDDTQVIASGIGEPKLSGMLSHIVMFFSILFGFCCMAFANCLSDSLTL